MDFSQHNDEVRQVWQAYREGTRWEDYLNDPALMFDASLKHAYAAAHHIPYQDSILGIPDEGWTVRPFFANIIDEAWFGCEIVNL